MVISKSSGLNDSIYGKSFAPIKQYLTGREELQTKASQLENLFYMDNTTNFAEKYTGETSLGDFEPGDEGGNYPEHDFQETYDKVIYPFEWKNSFSITQTMIEDAKMGKVKQKANAFMSSYARTKEKFGADMFTNGVATSMSFSGKTFDIATADAKALFATDHPSKTGEYAGQSNVYDTEWSYDAMSKLEALAANFRNDNGERLNINLDTIVVPYTTLADAAQRQELFEALNADGNPNTADRAGNYHAGRWNVISWPFLGTPAGMTAGKSWFFMIDKDYLQDYAAMVWLNRLDLNVKSYVNENNDNNIWKGRGRFGGSPVDWRFVIAGIPGVGSTLS